MLGGMENERKVFDAVHSAIEQNRLMQIDYTDSKLQPTTRTVEPMTLVFRWRSWYLFAYCQVRHDFRLFRMGRIRNPVPLDRRFIRRERPIEEYLSELDRSGWMRGVNMVLRFDKRIAHVATEVFGADAQECDEGGTIVRTSMSEDGRLYGFLLSFGSLLEVLEPPHLRQILAEEGRKITSLYRADG